MRSTTTEFLANQDSVFKNAVKNRLRPLVSSDKVFEDLLSRLRLDIDCLNPGNLTIIDNNLMNGINGALIKVMYLIYLFNNGSFVNYVSTLGYLVGRLNANQC